MKKPRAVTISITHDEYLAIMEAWGEYSSKSDGTEDEVFLNALERDFKHIDSFRKKYKKAVNSKIKNDQVKNALKRLRGNHE